MEVGWDVQVSSTWAVAVCGGLRDGPRQRAAAGLGGVLTEFLFVLGVCELDLEKKTGQNVSQRSKDPDVVFVSFYVHYVSVNNHEMGGSEEQKVPSSSSPQKQWHTLSYTQ